MMSLPDRVTIQAYDLVPCVKRELTRDGDYHLTTIRWGKKKKSVPLVIEVMAHGKILQFEGPFRGKMRDKTVQSLTPAQGWILAKGKVWNAERYSKELMHEFRIELRNMADKMNGKQGDLKRMEVLKELVFDGHRLLKDIWAAENLVLRDETEEEDEHDPNGRKGEEGEDGYENYEKGRQGEEDEIFGTGGHDKVAMDHKKSLKNELANLERLQNELARGSVKRLKQRTLGGLHTDHIPDEKQLKESSEREFWRMKESREREFWRKYYEKHGTGTNTNPTFTWPKVYWTSEEWKKLPQVYSLWA